MLKSLMLAARTTVYHRHILQDMGFGSWVAEPTVVYGDNDAATNLGREHMVTPGNRWFARDLFFSREQFKLKTIDPRRVGTDDNLADPMTKPLVYAKIIGLIMIMKGFAPSTWTRFPPPRD